MNNKSKYPTLDTIPEDMRMESFLCKFRRAASDDRLDLMFERVKRDLQTSLATGLITLEQFNLADIEAYRAYGRRQEEFDKGDIKLVGKSSVVFEIPNVECEARKDFGEAESLFSKMLKEMKA